MKLKAKFCIFLVLLTVNCYSQIDQFNYKRDLIGREDLWHKIILPNEMFEKISNDLSDIRIYGITPDQDTIEAPYLVQLNEEKIVINELELKVLNSTFNENGHYYTFEILSNESVNQILLDFNQQNFDAKLKLEGSQDQKQWYTIKDDYRILSIQNNLINYKFTKLDFQDCKYQFYRIHVKTNKKLNLKNAKISRYEIAEGNYRNYLIKNSQSLENKDTKQSEYTIDLKLKVPVCGIRIEVEDTFDYYRPIIIKYLTDSIETEQGWKYNYKTLASGTISSFENNEFVFKSTVLQRIKIVISNHDNQGLKIGEFIVKGYDHELIARFIEPAKYILVYGNSSIAKPNYDINVFTNKIPKDITSLELGAERIIEKDIQQEFNPLFENKIWLWIIMSVIILLLAWFSFKMLKGK